MNKDMLMLYNLIRLRLVKLGFTDANIEAVPETDPVLGSAVLTPAEAGELMEFVPPAFAMGLEVKLLPGDEPPYLRLTFDFSELAA